MVSREQIIRWLELTAAVMTENQEYLTQLDAAIGDAEHGITMARGFQKVSEKLPELVDKDIGVILKTTGTVLVSAMGGAGGLLYGTFFMEGGRALIGKTELAADDLAALLRAARAGIGKRGGANPGDKTMVDTLDPAVTTFEEAVAAGADVPEALRQMTSAAEAGMRATADMVARKGRASYLGERSLGHQDPGATSMYLMLKALCEAVTAS